MKTSYDLLQDKTNSLITLAISFLILLSMVYSLNPLTVPLSSLSSDFKKENWEDKAELVKIYKNLPISFISNTGNLDGEVKYYSRGLGYDFYLTGQGITYAFYQGDKSSVTLKKEIDFESDAPTKGYNLKVTFINQNAGASMEATRQQEGRINYFKGKNQDDWKTDVPAFGAVTYKNLYKGIDLTYKGSRGKLKYEFHVKPQADPKNIKLLYQGADGLSIDKKGNLLIDTPWGSLKDEKPYAYQLVGDKKEAVKASYIINDNTVGFSVSSYNSDLPLFIDPGLAYATFIGGDNNDFGYGLAVDSSGQAYMTGVTWSADFPSTAGAFDTGYDTGREAFVTKLNSSGTALVYSTFISGSVDDEGEDIEVDAAGNAYVSGWTWSPDFPTTTGAVSEVLNGPSDAFVSKLNTEGNALIYSTLLGGNSYEISYDLALDGSGNAYVIGNTRSANFPTTIGAFDTTYAGGEDAFVVKLNPVGTNLVYGSFLGGSGYEIGYELEIGQSGEAYLVGHTDSRDLPATGFDATYNGGLYDGFAAKFNASGSAVDYLTYLGGAADDRAYGLALDNSGDAYVTGKTDSADFPTTPGAYQTNAGLSSNAFVTKINPTGTSLDYSTYLSGDNFDVGYDVDLDSAGNAWIAGQTASANFPLTSGAVDAVFSGENEGFVVKLNSSGNDLLYSTFMGGSGSDMAEFITLDGTGNVYFSGVTNSVDFPVTPGAFDGGQNGNYDSFMVKLDLGFNLDPYKFVRGWGNFGTGDGQFKFPEGVAVDFQGFVYTVEATNHRVQKFDKEGNFITKWGSYGSGDGQFDNAEDIAVDSQGLIYVVDYGNNRIQKFDANGNFLEKWGSKGTGDGQLNLPWSMAIDSLDNVYVADTSNQRIQKFSKNGTFITKWGTFGSADGQFKGPIGVAVDQQGFVYVADNDNNRIQKFDKDGNFITKWGRYGDGGGEFNLPREVDVDLEGFVYVAEYGNDRVQKFDSKGNLITKWGKFGSGVDEFYHPTGIAVDDLGNVFITNYDHRVQKFNRAPITTLSTNPSVPDGQNGWYITAPSISLSRDESGITYYQWDSTSTTGWTSYTGFFSGREGDHTLYYYSVDDAGNAEAIKSRLFKVAWSEPSYVWINQFGTVGSDHIQNSATHPSGNTYLAGWTDSFFTGEIPSGNYDSLVRKLGPDGNVIWTDQFGTSADDFAYAVATDLYEDIYVVGQTVGMLTDASSYGGYDAFIRKYGSTGNILWTDQLGTPATDIIHDVAIDPIGNIYTAGYTQGSLPGASSLGNFDAFVRKYDSVGNILWTRQFGTSMLDTAFSITADSEGNVFVAGYTDGALPGEISTGGHDSYVMKFDAGGSLLWSEQFGSTEQNSYARGLALDSNDNIYVTGSSRGAIPGGVAFGDWDNYLRKYNSSGGLLWTNQFGTSLTDRTTDVTFNSDGNIYLTGWVDGALSGDTSAGAADIFIRKYDVLGTVLSTDQFGTSDADNAYGITNDAAGNLYVAGDTAGIMPYQVGVGAVDSFVMKFSTDEYAPLTTYETTPSLPNGLNGWFKTAPSITLTRNEPGTTYYQWDSSSTTSWTSYAGSFDGREGAHTLYYYSVDEAGNAENIKSQTVKFDAGIPSSFITSPLDGQTVSDTITVSAAVDDSLSGTSNIAEAVYSIDGGAPLPMSPADGAFDSPVETVTVQLDTTALSNGWHTITVSGRDSAGNWSTASQVTTNINNNDPPAVQPLGDIFINEGETRDIFVSAADVDGDIIALFTLGLPAFADFIDLGFGSGLLRLAPGYGDAGAYNAQILAFDGTAVAGQIINISVNNVNRPPVLENLTIPIEIKEGQPLQLNLSAGDPDGDALTYSAANMPFGATFDSGTGTFSWTPNYDQAGSYPGIIFGVSDGSLTDTETVTINVNNFNRPPVLDPIGDRIVNEGQLLQFSVAALDPDGDAVSRSVFNMPPGAAFDPATGVFSWSPDYTQAGTYPDIVFVATDDGAPAKDDSETVSIYVGNVNRAPVSNAGTDQTVHAGNPVTLDGSGSSDPDGGLLAYSWTILSAPPGSAAMLSNSGAVNPTLTADIVGDYAVQLVVADSQGAVGAADTAIISTTNSAPVADAGLDQLVFAPGSLVQLNGGQSYDLDGDPLAYRWEFATKPVGSNAVISGADGPMPTFIPDVYGEYVIQLTTSDPWAQSVPDYVVVGFENIRPVADAGLGQAVMVGEPVNLDGSGSFDANGDFLYYNWAIAAAPAGSLAYIQDPTAQLTSFVPDLAGTYVIQLVVSDGLLDSQPGAIQIQVVTFQSTAATMIQNVQGTIVSLDPIVFKNANMQNALINKLNAVLADIDAGLYQDALAKLQNDIRGKTDGCATTGTPDKNDWISDCPTQEVIYPQVVNLIYLLENRVQ